MIPSTDPAKQEARRIERQKRREERKKRREERNNPVEEGFDEENYSNGTVPIPDMIIPEYGDGAGVYPEYEDPYAGGGFEYQTGKKPVKNPIVQTPTENNSTVNEGSNSSSVVLNDGAVKIIVQKGEGSDEKLLAKKVRDILSDIQRSGTMRQGKETLIPEYR